MRKFVYFCSFIMIITIPVAISFFSGNIILRVPDVYLYYYNDSQCVDQLYTDLSNSEIADEIAGFMNSTNPSEFQIYENTGYDLQGIFSEEEGYNMLVLKRNMDISFIIFAVAFIISVAIYIFFLKNNLKDLLKKRFRWCIGLTLIFMALIFCGFSTNSGRVSISRFMGLEIVPEVCPLNTIMGAEFWNVASVFFLIISFAILIATCYLNYRLTKPSRIFY